MFEMIQRHSLRLICSSPGSSRSWKITETPPQSIITWVWLSVPFVTKESSCRIVKRIDLTGVFISSNRRCMILLSIKICTICSSVRSSSALRALPSISRSDWVVIILMRAVSATLFFKFFEVPLTRLHRAQLVYLMISGSLVDKIFVTNGSRTLYFRSVSLKLPSSAEMFPTAQAPCSKILSYLLARIFGRISKSPLLIRLSMWLREPAQMLVIHQVASS